jgi:D-sedoheptulose 7-phosphate isomerase
MDRRMMEHNHTTMKEIIRRRIRDSISAKQEMLQQEEAIDTLETCAQLLTAAFRNGNRVFFCGNGGSAADAQHLAAEFSGRFYLNRPALPAEALHCNSSYLTAVANDYGYDHVYARIIEGTGRAGDVLIGLSTSGNSTNICLALKAANEKKMITIGFTGASGGNMKPLCQYLLQAPTSDTPRIQECHMLAGHILCELTEKLFFETSEQ